jgi:hypothetical protein
MAVPVTPPGTVSGVQLAAVFQLPLVGFRFHTALLSAKQGEAKASKMAASQERVLTRGRLC